MTPAEYTENRQALELELKALRLDLWRVAILAITSSRHLQRLMECAAGPDKLKLREIAEDLTRALLSSDSGNQAQRILDRHFTKPE